MDSELPLLIVFDIDETLLQFMGGDKYHFFNEISLEDKKAIQVSNIEYLDEHKKNKNNCILFRPFLRNFLEMVKTNPRIHIALWTYSEHEYAEDIANIMTYHFGIKKERFIFTYGIEDIKDEEYPKNLEDIWKNFKMYNKFNTILIDDRLGNLKHDKNKENSIVCQGFAPFSEKKSRMPLTPELLQIAVNDTMFLELMKIIEQLFRHFDGCDAEDIEIACKMEHILNNKNVKKNKFEKYIQKIEAINKKGVKNIVDMFSIGDVSLSASEHKGGSRRKLKKRGIRKTKKNKGHKKIYKKN